MQPIDEKPVVIVERSGPSGNVFMVMANAVKALDEAGQDSRQLYQNLLDMMAKGNVSYEDMLAEIGKYVILEII